MADTEEEECNISLDANNVTMDTFYQSLITTNTQREKKTRSLQVRGKILWTRWHKYSKD